MKNKLTNITIFIIGLLLGGITTRYYYKNFILENDFQIKVGMVNIDKKVLDLLNNKEYDTAKTLFETKVKYEINNLETEWLIRGDSLYRNILFHTFIDPAKTMGISENWYLKNTITP